MRDLYVTRRYLDIKNRGQAKIKPFDIKSLISQPREMTQ